MSGGPKLEKFEGGIGVIGIPVFVVIAVLVFAKLTTL